MVWFKPPADSATIIEDWEDTTHSEWRHLDPVSDDTAYVTDIVWHGSQALEKSGYDEAFSFPGDGLSEYFSKGQEWSFYVYVRSGMATGAFGIYFGARDRDSAYATQWDGVNDDRIESYVRVNDTGQSFIGRSGTMVENEWVEITVKWDDGTLGGADNDITVTWTRLDTKAVIAEHTGNDATFDTESGIGFWNSSGIVTIFDAFTNGRGTQTTNETVAAVLEDWEGTTPLAKYSGTTSTYSIVSTPSYDGTAGGSGDGNFDIIYDPDAGAPPKGSTFEAYVRSSVTSATQDVGIYFGVQDASNLYFVEMQVDEGEFVAKTRNGGSYTPLGTDTGLSLSANTWYRIRVRWDDGVAYGGADGDMTFTLIEDATDAIVASFSATNTDHPTGGYGFKYHTASNGNPVFHDLYQVIEQP